MTMVPCRPDDDFLERVGAIWTNHLVVHVKQPPGWIDHLTDRRATDPRIAKIGVALGATLHVWSELWPNRLPLRAGVRGFYTRPPERFRPERFLFLAFALRNPDAVKQWSALVERLPLLADERRAFTRDPTEAAATRLLVLARMAAS